MAKRQSFSGQDLNATVITDLPAPSGSTDAARKGYVDDTKASILSQGFNVITNGNGSLGDNENFTAFTYDATDAPVGAKGSFDATYGLGGTYLIDEFVPVDPNKTSYFEFSCKQKGITATGYAYALIQPYDAYGSAISSIHYMWIPNTLTTLAAPLNPGNTTVTLTSSANWYGSAGKPGGASTYLRSFIFWDYVDPGGKAWEEETYSRNNYGVNLWADGGVVGNVITLAAPWAGPAKAAGTKVSNGSAGGTYMYGGMVNTIVPKAWTKYSAGVTGLVQNGASATFAGGWPQGVAQAKLGFLLNRTLAGASDTDSQHSVALLSFYDGRPPTSHTHLRAEVTDLGTAAAKNFPVSGNATGTDVVLASDTRLSDSRTPVAHTHVPLDIPLGSAKFYVRAATTANITLSGLQAIDGYTVTAGERVLVKNQTAPAENGIYNAATGAWTRAVDANTAPHFYGANVTPHTGSANAGKTFRITNWTSGSTLGSSSQVWAQVSDATHGHALTDPLITGIIPDAQLPTRLATAVNTGVGQVTNPDSVAVTGWNYWSGASAIGMSDAVLFTIRYSANYAAQTAYSLNAADGAETWRRTQSGGTWGSWVLLQEAALAAAAFARDPAAVLTATAMTAYGDSFAAEYGLTANTGFISQAATALGMTTPMVNKAASGSSGRSVGHLALGVAALGFRWVAATSGVVTVHAGLNDAREFNLTLAANAKYIKAYKNSLRILATLIQGKERVDYTDGSWAFAGTWNTGAYNFTSSGTAKGSLVNDSTATITFTGPEISLILGHAYGQTADCEVKIDGIPVSNIHLEEEATNGNGEALSIGWAVHQFAGLGDGPHTVQLRRTAGSSYFYVDSYVLPSQTTPQVKFVEAAYMDPTQYSLYSPYNVGSNASIDRTRYAMRDVAAEFNNVTMVPAVTLTAVTDYQADKVHPNATGTTKLTNALQASLTTRVSLQDRVAELLGSNPVRDVLGFQYASKKQVDEGSFNRLAIRTIQQINPSTLVIDAALGSVEIFQLGVSIGASSVVNARAGDLRIMHYRSAAETMVWPTNFRWINNTAPAAITAGTRNFYTMTYSPTTGLWSECAARALAIPYT